MRPTSVQAMRPGDFLLPVSSGAGSAAMLWNQEWFAALVIVILSLLFADIRRAGGVGAWALELSEAREAWGEASDQRAKHLSKRRREKLREKQKRREIRRSSKR